MQELGLLALCFCDMLSSTRAPPLPVLRNQRRRLLRPIEYKPAKAETQFRDYFWQYLWFPSDLFPDRTIPRHKMAKSTPVSIFRHAPLDYQPAPKTNLQVGQ